MRQKRQIRLLTLIFSILLLLSSAVPVQAAGKEEADALLSSLPADAFPAAPSIESPAAILMEVKTGTVLYAKNATEQRYPASTTKILTGLLAIENCSMDETVTISRTAVNSLTPGSSHIGLKAGEQLTVMQCLYGLLLPSANEVAYALAEHVSGSSSQFVNLMNQRASELGCVNTHFSNPSGLHDPQHYTCAYDLAKIFSACIQNPAFLTVDSTPSYVLPATNLTAQTRPMSTTHLMLRKNSAYYNADVKGGKTGSTPEAGRCLITYAQKDTMEVIAVTMGAEDPAQYTDTQKLLNYAFGHFTCVYPSETSSAKEGSASPLDTGNGSPASFHIEETSSVVLPDTLDFSSLEANASYFPETEDGQVGAISYSYEGYPLGTAVLLSSVHNENELIYKEEGETALSLAQTVLSRNSHLIVIRLWLLALIVLGAGLIGVCIYFLARYFSPRNRNNHRRNHRKGKLHF